MVWVPKKGLLVPDQGPRVVPLSETWRKRLRRLHIFPAQGQRCSFLCDLLGQCGGFAVGLPDFRRGRIGKGPVLIDSRRDPNPELPSGFVQAVERPIAGRRLQHSQLFQVDRELILAACQALPKLINVVEQGRNLLLFSSAHGTNPLDLPAYFCNEIKHLERN